MKAADNPAAAALAVIPSSYCYCVFHILDCFPRAA